MNFCQIKLCALQKVCRIPSQKKKKKAGNWSAEAESSPHRTNGSRSAGKHRPRDVSTPVAENPRSRSSKDERLLPLSVLPPYKGVSFFLLSSCSVSCHRLQMANTLKSTTASLTSSTDFVELPSPPMEDDHATTLLAEIHGTAQFIEAVSRAPWRVEDVRRLRIAASMMTAAVRELEHALSVRRAS